ncbi:hypothetical protein JCM8547_009273 [Rhodosporidiobolus lusitaniae]
MAAVLSSPTPSYPSSSVPIVTPPLLGSPELPQDEHPPSSPSSATTGSGPSTPTGSAHYSGLVPAYPYNVAMVPAAVNGGPLPDDSEVTTRLPSICVDYLSHDWAEDDVWTSWKAMTRHKAEIANGVRLENASWRTWAKQRGKLKTVSPETLNWLKDSDVTWLYGPLHTAVEAVPPPKEATASERLGLEPLRSLSDAKAAKEKKKSGEGSVPPSPAKKENMALPPAPSAASLLKRRGSAREYKTKPILKYRSLSDILMPQNTPTSPVIEQLGMDFEDQATISVHHARSDSHLVRLNSLNRHRKRTSPIHSPGSSSPERTASDSSSAAGNFLRTAQKKRDRRHISFNHRVEQCIAIDSSEEKAFSTAASSSDEEDDDDVLTFGARSPRHNTFARLPPVKPEPHTIARLGPTTLKSVELYPAPSPAVVFSSDPTEYDDSTSSSPPEGSGAFGQQHVEEYDGGRSEQLRRQQQAGQQALFDYSNSQARGSQWDPEDEDDYAMGFDYFTAAPNGPDVSVGDEYDMAQYGSTHLIGGSHNNYRPGSGSESSSSYLGGGPYSPNSPYNPNSNSTALDPSYHTTSAQQIPHYRDSGSGSGSTDDSSSTILPIPVVSASPTTTVSAAVRGPHSPTTAAAAPPKRSAMKGGRSRESSNESTPSSSGAPSPSLTASTSPPTGLNAIATAIPPHVRPAVRRNNSSEDGRDFQERGRSASRGSSSSLEREASANRRSSSSISPTSSYSPPGYQSGSGSAFALGASGTYGSPASGGAGAAAAAAAGAQPIAIQPRGMGGGAGSYDSLSSVMNGGRGAAGGYLPDVPEAGESPQGSSGGGMGKSGLGRIVTSSSVDSMGSLGSFGAGQTPTSPTVASLPSPARSRFSIGSVVDQEDDDEGHVEDVAAVVHPVVGRDEVDLKRQENKEKERKQKEQEASKPASSPAVSSPPAPTPSATTSTSNPSSLGHSRTPSLPRLRNASPSTVPSAPGKSTPSEDGHSSPSEPALARTAAVPSPPIATASTVPPSPPSRSESDSAAPGGKSSSSSSSYARRSLLRASRASSDSGSGRSSTSREREHFSSSSSSSGVPAGDHDYAFGADDGVGKGIDVAGTARDLLGAISKGIWGSLGSGGSGSSSSSSGGGGEGRGKR